MPIEFAARMPTMRPDSIAAMRAVAMLVAVWLATPIPVRRNAATELRRFIDRLWLYGCRLTSTQPRRHTSPSVEGDAAIFLVFRARAPPTLPAGRLDTHTHFTNIFAASIPGSPSRRAHIKGTARRIAVGRAIRLPDGARAQSSGAGAGAGSGHSAGGAGPRCCDCLAAHWRRRCACAIGSPPASCPREDLCGCAQCGEVT